MSDQLTKKVDIWIWPSTDYMWRGDSFSEELHISLLESLKHERDFRREKGTVHLPDKEALLLSEYVRKVRRGKIPLHGWDEPRKGSHHPQDILFDLTQTDFTLDFDFAKSLNLFDVIQAECWKGSTPEAEALIDLIYGNDIMFVLVMKRYVSMQHMKMEFRASHDDQVDEMMKKLISTGITS